MTKIFGIHGIIEHFLVASRLVWGNLQWAFFYANTIAIRFFLYTEAIAWGSLYLASRNEHLYLLSNLLSIKTSVISPLINYALPILVIAYGTISLAVLLLKIKNTRLTFFSSLSGALLFTLILNLELLAHYIILEKMAIEVPTVWVTITSWWILIRDLINCKRKGKVTYGV